MRLVCFVFENVNSSLDELVNIVNKLVNKVVKRWGCLFMIFFACFCQLFHCGAMWHTTHTHRHTPLPVNHSTLPTTSPVQPSTNSLPLMNDQPISCSCFMMSYDTCLWLVDFSCLKLFLCLRDDLQNDKDYWKYQKPSVINELNSTAWRNAALWPMIIIYAVLYCSVSVCSVTSV